MASPNIGIFGHSVLSSIANENFKLFRGLRGRESDGHVWCVGLKDAPSRHNADVDPPVIRMVHGKLRELHNGWEDLTYYVPKGKL